MESKTVYIIAGEASGDLLGAKLIKALRAKDKNYIEFIGIGGEHMIGQGLKSLFPMSELSIMGWAEIIPHIPHLLKRIRQTVEDIKKNKPDIVITIDSPGFNFRVAKELQESGIKLVHYVAPTVWAYKPERAQKVANLFDHILLLLPFEPPYFNEVGIANTFIGHPIIEENIDKADGVEFRQHNNIPTNAPLLCLLPGSRNTEIKKLFPIFKKTIALLKKKHQMLHVVIPTIQPMHQKISEFAKTLPAKAIVVSSSKDKYDAYRASNVALVKSGTASLELAMAKVPMVITYKVGAISAWMAKKMITVQYANLINLIHNKLVIPELLQSDCTPKQLANAVEELLKDKKRQKNQCKEIETALEKLGTKEKLMPSEKAALTILQIMQKN